MLAPYWFRPLRRGCQFLSIVRALQCSISPGKKELSVNSSFERTNINEKGDKCGVVGSACLLCMRKHC